MRRTKGVFIVLIVLTLFAGCAGHMRGGADAQAGKLRSDESLAGLMRYCSYMATLSGEPYQEELRKVAEAYSESETKAGGAGESQTLRMAIALMNPAADDAAAQYRRAEKLLVAHLDETSPNFFNKDYRALAQFLLRTNREWQSLNNELIVARIEKARAEKQIEQLKSIEMDMNSPGNNFH